MFKLKSALGFGTFGLCVTIILLFPNLLFAFQNEPEGFRGVKWGTNITELPDMVFQGSRGEKKLYFKKNDKMKIGDADIQSIGYFFYKEKFYNVLIEFSNLTNFVRIKETCDQLYGSGYRPNRFMEQYFWRGGNVTIFLHYNEISKEGMLSYQFKTIAEEEQADEKTNSKKAAGDL